MHHEGDRRVPEPVKSQAPEYDWRAHYLELLQSISLAVSESRRTDSVLQGIVTGLVERTGCALARIWLRDKGDICDRCQMRSECADRTECLHLRATAGKPTNPESGHLWHRMDGDFQRFPLGARIIGRVGASGKAEFLRETADDARWIGRADWLRREGVRTFVGQPLRFRGEMLGVLGVFTRELLSAEEVSWLGLFADQAAVALANAAAFEKIDRLQKQLELENEYLRGEINSARGFGEIVGCSSALRKVLDQVELVGPVDSTVLISGESGTGKELIARAIHRCSRRKDRPMVTVNCGSIPRDLFESEFFGHVKGAFTSAVRDRVGRFQLADGGTLFLDEIGEIPIDLQSKLLRVLQEGTFEPVGDDRTRRVDVRVVAATNRDLRAATEAGGFREDLYYRLSVFPIDVIPLRQRIDDIPLLADLFLQRSCSRLGVRPLKLEGRHVERMQGYSWPGNVRELQNVIERAVIRAQRGVLDFEIPAAIDDTRTAATAPGSAEAPKRVLTRDEVKRMERENLLAALEATGWQLSGPNGAAALLGLRPTTLASRMKALGLKRR